MPRRRKRHDQLKFLSEMGGLFNIWKFINTIHYFKPLMQEK